MSTARYFTKVGGWAGDTAYLVYPDPVHDTRGYFVDRAGRQLPEPVRMRLIDAEALANDLHELTEITVDQAADLVWDHLTHATESLT